MSKTTLDEILFNLCDLSYASFTTQEEADRVADQLDYDRAEAKQAILRWVADEVIGNNENTRHLESPMWNVVGGRNELRGEQMQILFQYGYKGGK